MNDDSRTLQTLRMMAWERAKGELLSILHTFYDSSDDERKQYNEIEGKIHAFIEDIENDSPLA